MAPVSFRPEDSSGLFVGVSCFEDPGLPALPHATDDAVDMAYLLALRLGLLVPARVRLALAGEPRKPGSRARLAELLRQGAQRSDARYRTLLDLLKQAATDLRPAGLLAVLLSTHGFVVDGVNYLVPADALRSRVERTSLDRPFVEEQLAQAHRGLLLLDACREPLVRPRSASARSSARALPNLRELLPFAEGAADAAPTVGEDLAAGLASARGLCTLAAATPHGLAYDDDRLGNSVFTAAVLAGLGGHARPDTRGFVTAGTLSGFVMEHVRAWLDAQGLAPGDGVYGIEESFAGLARELPLACSLQPPVDPALLETEPESPPPVARALERAYLEASLREHRQLLRVFRQAPDRALEDVFVAVRVSGQAARADLDGLGLDGCALPGALRPPRAVRELDRRDLEDVLASEPGRCWTLVGNPGAGKTTLLRRIATSRGQAALARLDRGEVREWLPVFVNLAPWIASGEGLLEYVEASVRRAAVPPGLASHLGEAARTGRLLLLLDGLDEVDPAQVRIAAHQVGWLAERWPAVHIVLSSRPHRYVRPSRRFGELTLLPLDAEAQRDLAGRWLAAEQAEALLARVASDLSLRELAEVPLLLTMMCLVEREGAEAGDLRSTLYSQVVDLLLRGRPLGGEFAGRELRARRIARRALQRLALGLLERGGDTWELDALEDLLVLDAPTWSRLAPVWKHSVGAFLREVEEVSGLLFAVDSERERYRFLHRSLQEYLAACALAERGAAWRELAAKIESEEGRWAEVFSLLAGTLERAPAVELLRELAERKPAVGLRALATCDELSDDDVLEVLAIGRPAMDWSGSTMPFEQYVEKTQELHQRASYFAELPARLGEPERAVRLLERLLPGAPVVDLAFVWLALETIDHDDARALLERETFFARAERPLAEVELTCASIPAGSFVMGDDEGAPTWFPLHPRHEVRLSQGFRLLVTPVTNAIYERFDPKHRGQRGEHQDDQHPVVNVTWYEAFIASRWLGARLPSEAEWEYACRAGTTTAYWSGDTEADLARVGWYDANSDGRTHRVGEKPANPWGLHDMHGNVWEWCQDGPRNYTKEDTEDPEGPDSGGRVIRGGGYWDGAGGARSAYRGRDGPTGRGDVIGFRVVLPAAPPPGLRS